MIVNGDSAYLFHEVPFTGPLDELRATLDKKLRTHLNLGENDQAERLERAYLIARETLEAVLVAPATSLRMPSGTATTENAESVVSGENASTALPPASEIATPLDDSPDAQVRS